MVKIVYKYSKQGILALLFALIAMQTNAQTPDIGLKIKIIPDSILIGDHVKFSFQATYDSTQQAIALPEFKDNKMGPAIDIIETLELDTIKREGRLITIEQPYIITSYDSGQYIMQASMLLQTITSDTIMLDTLNFPPAVLYVNTIPIDTTTYIMYDIKAVSEYPFVIWDYWWIGAIILGLALITLAVWWYLRWKKNKGGLFVFTRAQDPPYVIALNELQKLKEEKLWEQDKTKQYYTRLADIVRQYLEDRFGLQAMEKTSEEILQDLKNTDFDNKKLYDELKEMLNYSDLAKFAKYKPSAFENERAHQYAYNFIDGTKQSMKDNSDTNNINTQNDNNTEI